MCGLFDRAKLECLLALSQNMDYRLISKTSNM